MRARDLLLLAIGFVAGAVIAAAGVFVAWGDGAGAPTRPAPDAAADADADAADPSSRDEPRLADLVAENAELRRRLDERRERVRVDPTAGREDASAPGAETEWEIGSEQESPTIEALRRAIEDEMEVLRERASEGSPHSPFAPSGLPFLSGSQPVLSAAQARELIDVALDAAATPGARLDAARLLASARPADLAAEADRFLTDRAVPGSLRSIVLTSVLSAAREEAPVPSSVRSIAFDTTAASDEWSLAAQSLLIGTPSEGRAVIQSRLASPEPAERSVAVAALAGGRSHAELPFMVETIMRADLRDVVDPLIDAIATTKGLKWSAEQMTGPPDVPRGGDLGTAWAPKRQQMGSVTVQLIYAQAVRPAEVRVRETLAPGAVAEIEVSEGDGSWTTVWTGIAPIETAPRWFAPALSTLELGDGHAITRVRLTLDTDRVDGWNEIDAVELVGADGSRQWASVASASSSYSD